MNIPPEALEGIRKTLIGMLPYSETSDVNVPEAEKFRNIFMLLCNVFPEFSDANGFINFFMRKINESEDMQKKLNTFYADVLHILGENNDN